MQANFKVGHSRLLRCNYNFQQPYHTTRACWSEANWSCAESAEPLQGCRDQSPKQSEGRGQTWTEADLGPVTALVSAHTEAQDDCGDQLTVDPSDPKVLPCLLPADNDKWKDYTAFLL